MREIDWTSFSEAMNEWREHKVTVVLRRVLEGQANHRKDLLCKKYLAGKPASEAERLAVLMLAELVEDLFDADAEDVRAALEQVDEQLGNNAY